MKKWSIARSFLLYCKVSQGLDPELLMNDLTRSKVFVHIRANKLSISFTAFPQSYGKIAHLFRQQLNISEPDLVAIAENMCFTTEQGFLIACSDAKWSCRKTHLNFYDRATRFQYT